MIPARAPELKGEFWRGGTANLYLLELDRTVMLSNGLAITRAASPKFLRAYPV